LLLAAPALAFVLALRPVDNFDLGFHLRIGEYVLAKGIPTTDPFSWPGEGRPWALEQWIGPVAFHLAHRAAGLAGVLVMRAIVVALAYLLVSVAARAAAGDAVVGAVASLIAVEAGEPRFVAMPYVFSLLGVSVVVLALAHVQRTGRLRAMWGLVPLFALWPHVHPGFLAAYAAMGAFALGVLAESVVAARWPARACGPTGVRLVAGLAAAGVACALATAASLLLLHPMHLDALRKVLSIFASDVNRASIVEYQSLGRSYALTAPMILLAAVPALVWAVRRREVPLAHAVLLVVFVWQTARVGRLVGEASIVLAPVWAAAAGGGWRALAARGIVDRLRARIPAAVAGLAVLAAGALPAVAHVLDPLRSSLVWPDAYYPRECYEWIDRAGLPPKVFNDLWFGGSFIAHFGERRKTFIDGRSFYSERFFVEDYAPVKQAAPGWRKKVRELGIEWFLLKPGRFQRLHDALGRAGWVLAHEEENCAVYVPPQGLAPAAQ